MISDYGPPSRKQVESMEFHPNQQLDISDEDQYSRIYERSFDPSIPTTPNNNKKEGGSVELSMNKVAPQIGLMEGSSVDLRQESKNLLV